MTKTEPLRLSEDEVYQNNSGLIDRALQANDLLFNLSLTTRKQHEYMYKSIKAYASDLGIAVKKEGHHVYGIKRKKVNSGS